MKSLTLVLRVGLFVEFVTIATSSPVIPQVETRAQSDQLAAETRELLGDDAQRASKLEEEFAKARAADRWDEAISKAQELVALRTRGQGAAHFDTVRAEWQLKTVRLVSALPREDRAAFLSARDLTKEGEALFRQGKYADAQPLFERALAIRRRLLTDDHPDTAQTFSQLAVNLGAQAKYAAAEPYCEKTLTIYRRLFSDDHPYTAVSFNNLATNLNAQGKYGLAQPMFEKSLEIHRRLLGDQDSEAALFYKNLANNLTAQGKYQKARPLLEKALEIRRTVLTGDHADVAESYSALAINLDHLGNYAAAQPLAEKGLELNRRLLSDDHPDTASSFNTLAVNLLYQGKYAEAQPLFEKALEIQRRLLTDEHPRTAESYNNLASNLRRQNKYVLAQPLFEKSLAIRRRLLTDDHPETAAGYNNLADILNLQGKHETAQALLEKALGIRRRVLTDDHPETAAGYHNLARNLDAQGKFKAAQPLHERAIEIDRGILSESDPSVAVIYDSLALNLDAQGKYAAARDQWIRGAHSFEQARLSTAFGGLDRSIATTSVYSLAALASVLARLGQPTDAWQYLEKELGRGLLDELAARQDQRLAPAESTRLQELVAAFEQLDRLVGTAPSGLDQAERAKRFEDLKRQRTVASIALGEFQTKLVQTYGPLAGPVARLDEIQSALPGDAALIAWVDIPPVGPNAADPDGAHWGVVVRSRGVPTWVSIAGTGAGGLWTPEDSGLAARVRAALRTRPGAGASDLLALTEKLRTQRIEPLAQALAATTGGLSPIRRLIVLPSKAMAGIPIDALLSPNDDRTVSYAPSATVYKYLRGQARPDRHAGLLALGDAVYERPHESSGPKPVPDHGLLVNVVIPGSNAATHGLKPGDVLLAYNGVALHKKEELKIKPTGNIPIGIEVWREGKVSMRDLAPGKVGIVLDARPAPVAMAEQQKLQNVLVAVRGGDDVFARLPGTRFEVEAIARLFQSDDRPTRLLLGTDASEPEIDRLASTGELGRFGFIHLATHGKIDEEVSARSAVILTQTGLPDPLEQILHHQPAFDGRLSVREIQRGWNLKAELVTLSACETALGRDAGGEGFVGFTQALLMSGTRSVCLSLWKVDDTATALLMQRFYANLLGRRPGLASQIPKAEALREAKSWLRTLRRKDALALTAAISGGTERGKGNKGRQPVDLAAAVASGNDNDSPFASPHFWAAFVLAGDPD